MAYEDCPPALAAPAGTKSNFINPDTQLNGHIALHTVFLGLATMGLVMRLYTRKFVQRRLGLDDGVIVFGFCFSVVFSALNIRADVKGMARHMWDFPFSRDNWIAAFKPFIIATFTYILSAASIKLSCLLFYRHIFSPSHKTMWFINGGIAFVICAYTACFFSAIFECIPMQRNWDPFAKTGRCFDSRIQTYGNAGINTLTDIYVLVVPLPAVWGLPLSTGRRFRVLAVFGLGLCACITSIVRLSLMPKLYVDEDVTWNMSEVSIWSVIEINVGITCSCLLVLPAFLKRHLPPGFSSTVARLIPCCFGRGFQDSTTKTYMSGSTLSHQADRSGEFSVEPDHPKSPTSVVAYPIPGYTTLITPENLHDLESQDRGGPHTG